MKTHMPDQSEYDDMNNLLRSEIKAAGGTPPPKTDDPVADYSRLKGDLSMIRLRGNRNASNAEGGRAASKPAAQAAAARGPRNWTALAQAAIDAQQAGR